MYLCSPMYQRYFYILICLFLTGTFYSQSTQQAIANGQDPNVLYRNEMSFGIFAHSRGFGLNFYRAKHVTATRKKILEVQALNMKHPKEIKISNNVDNSKKFIYGKLNNILLFRGGVGYQTTLFRRADRKSVEIRSSYYLGGNATFAKPTYILVLRKNSNEMSYQEAVKYNPEVHTIDSIYGRGPLVDGLSELKIYPAAYAKVNLSFEFAPMSNKVKAIETGLIVDYYPKALPIMAHNPAENFIVTVYVGFVFGKKWF